MRTELLEKIGLTKSEVKVYLALLELGSSSTGPIVDKSGASSSKIYEILEKLIQKGLVSYIIKGKVKYFQAASPHKILSYLHEQENAFKDTVQEIQEILPALIEKQKVMSKSEANIYLGFKGIRTAYEKIYEKLKKGEEYFYLGIHSYQPEAMHVYWKRDHVRSVKAGIKRKLLFNRDTDPKILKNRNSYKWCDARYMPLGIKTPAGFLIYKDTVVVILQSPVAIAVEIVNQDIEDSFKSYFDEFWRRSKKFKTTKE